nr:hypothetical protein KPHV_01750 [Kitasatospora purpeofusca]
MTRHVPGRPDHHDVYAAHCPCRAMLDLLSDKWSALAIGALEQGPGGSANSSGGCRASVPRC